ncbi:hypothetical protein PGT21_004227 [Puccinia graminis f. sp. tritici]|uniref:RlpA-like protein double-psi beta-barrel domain-containing protein n=1 Tax=Puccinia graminis f. sp. tritici TaxID=56615 RepID=A0A5B0S5G2_PUCGR|nr:hypothetical protein PGT21_004227 [Puccinia graminis f. sp. tritici]KAA1132719.1 hypothetical protein PGTUg99_018702 [Puccinia graminis f. sp. tritici]
MHWTVLLPFTLTLANDAWCSPTGPHFKHQSRKAVTVGEARYYDLATGAQTACGGHHSSSEMVCAASASVFDQGKKCGKSLRIYHGSVHVDCLLDDECPSCKNDSLDLSPAVFKALGPLSQGVLNVCHNHRMSKPQSKDPHIDGFWSS